MARVARVAGFMAVLLVVAIVPGGVAPASGVAARGAAMASRAQFLSGDLRLSGPAATGNETWNAVAYGSAAGEFLVVWIDDRDDPNGHYTNVYGQRVSASGSPVGADFRITGPGATNVETYPAVAYSPTSNEFLVVWEDSRDFGTRDWDIYGRRVSASGSPVGADFRINNCPKPAGIEDLDSSPEVIYDPGTDGFLVLWTDGRDSLTRGSDIYGQRLATDGSPIGGNTRISSPSQTADEGAASTAHNPATGEFLVVWSDSRNFATREWDIYGQRLSASGARLGGDFRISGPGAAGWESEPSVAYDPAANEYLVVWSDTRGLGVTSDIFGQQLAANGARIGGNFRISGPEGTTGNWDSSVAYDSASDQFLVIWTDSRNRPTRGYDIYGRRISASGSPASGQFRITGGGGAADQTRPSVAYDSATSQFLVIWMDWRNLSTRGFDIYGRRVAG